MRDSTLKIVRQFLSGEMTVEEVTERHSANKPEKGMTYEPCAKVAIAWCLALAKPGAFGLRYYNGKLIGSLDDAWSIVFPEEKCLSTYSWRERLHSTTIDEHGRKTRHLTPSQELIEEIVKYIGNPQSGIARYFRDRQLTVPMALDSQALQTLATKPPAPIVRTIARQLAEDLRSRHKPSVIAELRRIL